MKVSVILPARNEANYIQPALLEITQYLLQKKYSFEVIVINNGSTDKTGEIVQKLAEKFKQIKLTISKPGYGLALQKGLVEAKGDYLIIFNVDFWDKKFIDLVRVDLLDYDIAVGSKNLASSSDKRPWQRRLATRGFNFFLRIFFGFQGTDTHGIKIFRAERILPVVKKCKTKTGIFDSELLIRTQRQGLRILELPVEVAEKRPSRFGVRRIFQTPKDIFNLYLALRREWK